MANRVSITWVTPKVGARKIIHTFDDGSAREYTEADRARYVQDNLDRPAALDDLKALGWETRGLHDPREALRAAEQERVAADIAKDLRLLR